MSTIRIYTPQSLQVDALLILEAKASNHLLKVLRCRVGQPLVLFNGQGGEYAAHLAAIQKNSAHIQIDHFAAVERVAPVRMTLAPALLGGARMDLIIQKAVELGVDAITPIVSSRVEAKIPTQRLDSRLAHWQKVVVSASEQCGRNRLAMVQPPRALAEWLQQCQSTVRLFGDPQGQPWSEITPARAHDTVAFLLGPEGGFSSEEVALIQQYRFRGVSMGACILRAETAAIAAAAIVQNVWG